MIMLSFTFSDLSINFDVFKDLREYTGDIDTKFMKIWKHTIQTRQELFRTTPLHEIFKAFPFFSKQNGFKLVRKIKLLYVGFAELITFA